MNAKELLEIAYVTKRWNIKMSPEEVCKLIDDARKYADNYYYVIGLR